MRKKIHKIKSFFADFGALAILIGVFIGGTALYFFYFTVSEAEVPGCKKNFFCQYGLLYADEKSSYRGYTLVNPRRGDTIFLINWSGKLVHKWKIPNLPAQSEILSDPESSALGSLQAKLLSSGNLLVAHGGPEPGAYEKPVTGTFVTLLELDWDGNVLWEYKNNAMHHDFERLKDGKTAVIIWERLLDEFANKIKGGIPGSEYAGSVYSDAIIEVDGQGREVWRWSLKDHLDPDDPRNTLDRFSSRNTWTHLDAIEYLEKNPVNGTPGYLLSINYLDTLAIVERASGKIIWRWGDGFLGGQHSVGLTTRGTIITFDTGKYRDHFRESRKTKFTGYTIPFSRVVEVDILQRAVKNIFSPGPLQPVRAHFYSPINGSVQALPNGNVLVSAGITGKIFEVNMGSGKVVWDFESPFGPILEEWPTVIENSVFSAYRYPEDYTERFKGFSIR